MKIGVEVYNPETGETIKKYESIQAAVKDLDWTYYRVRKTAEDNDYYKNTYLRFSKEQEND